jgi:hypothetical protein
MNNEFWYTKYKNGNRGVVLKMEKYIVLTNKETFQTVLENDGFQPVETYHFYFFDKLKSTYTIARVLDDDAKIQLYEKYEGKEYINHIRMKFFESFETIDGAREELYEIVKANGNSEDSKHSKLVKSDELAV